MKSSLLILFGITMWLPAYQQNTDVLQVDKLKRELRSTKADSSQALILAQLAEAYRERISDTSFYYGQKALELSKRINYARGEAKALLSLSHFFYNKGDLPQALELGLKGLALAKKLNIRYDQAFAMIRIGNVYMDLGDYREALRYYHQTRRLTENTEDAFFYAVTFWRAADAYMNLKMTDSALYDVKIAEDLAQKMGNKMIIWGIAPIFGAAYAQMGNDQLALNYLHRNKGTRGSHILAVFYKERGVYDSAKYYAHRSYDFAINNKVKQTELNAATLLSSLYEATDPGKALHFQKIAMAARESLYGAEKILAATSVAFKEKEQQNEILMAQMEYRNKIKIYASLVGLVLVIFIALLLFRNNRNERKANVLLQRQKNEISKALSELRITQSQLIQSEKMASLGELTAGIAHEIQNPLNFVNNFSEVSNELIREIQDIRRKVQDQNVESEEDDILNGIAQNLEKILHHGKRADAIVKGMLQHSRISTGQKEPTDINALCDEYLRLSYHGLRAKDKSFNAKFELQRDTTLPKLDVVPQDIGRVILNLINNAFYAVSERKKAESGKADSSYEPTVLVTTKSLGNQIAISVKDNGNGIPDSIKEKIFQPFFTTKPTGQGTGLGLSLSYDIVKAHGGELKVETIEGAGSEFLILLPA